MLRDYRRVYRSDPHLAKRLIGHGEAPTTATIAPEKLAAWTMIANTILNLDETINQH